MVETVALILRSHACREAGQGGQEDCQQVELVMTVVVSKMCRPRIQSRACEYSRVRS
jgi:hypothetical protein